MDKKVKFYTIAIVDKHGVVTNISIKNFLDSIEELFLGGRIKTPINTYNKDVYMFKYVRETTEEFVIPFGTLKYNTPYCEIEGKPQEITPTTMRLYDVNLMYYNSRENIVAITCDRVAPNNKVIAAFLSELIHSDDYTVEIRPILYESGIEVIQNSKFVKSVTIVINLDKNLQEYYNDNIKHDGMLTKQLLELMFSSKQNMESSSFKLTLGLGRSRRDSMNKENVMSLLNSLDLQSDVVREVSLNYVDGSTQSVQIAKLKHHELELNAMLKHDGKGSLLAGDMIYAMPKAIEDNRRLINTKVRNFFHKKRQVNDTVDSLLSGDIDGKL